jgi:hypothetical protein
LKRGFSWKCTEYDQPRLAELSLPLKALNELRNSSVLQMISQIVIKRRYLL